MYYLYLKTHRETGLKYLGQTKRDPHKYKGSGKYWKQHVKKHGDNIDTLILQECSNMNVLKEAGMLYSRLWDVENNPEFANLKPENGDGGGLPSGEKHPNWGKVASKETRKKMSDAHKGRKYSPEFGQQISERQQGANNPFYGKTHTKEARENIRKNHAKSKPVVVDGVWYSSMLQAAKSNGVAHSTAKKRINSKNFNWEYA